MNTRVAVPLSKEAYEAVSLIADISGVSRGRILADTLQAAIPSFMAISEAYKAALAVEGAERQAIIRAMGEAENYLLDAVSHIEKKIAEKAGAPSDDPRLEEGAGGASEGESDPPILTGGFTTSVNGGQNEI